LNPLSLLFLFLVVAIGGVIAYFADRLGRVLGKKRLSLLGMRPRHTAEFLTVCAGALIPLLTVSIVMLASAGVREWLLHGPALIAERNKAVGERTTARLELVSIGQQLTREQGRLNALQGKLTETERVLRDLRKTEQSLRKDVSLKTQQLGSARNQFKIVDYQYTSVRKSFGTLRQTYGALNSTYRSLNSQYKSLNTSYRELDRLRKEADAEVTRDRAEVDKLTTRLNTEQFQLQQTRTEYAQTQKDLDRAKHDLESAKLDLDDVNAQLKLTRSQLQQTSETLITVKNITRIQPLMFARGEELARASLEQGLSEEQARIQVQRLIADASRVARQRGASTEGTHASEAGFILMPTQQGMLTTKEQEDDYVRLISRANRPTVIVALAFNNTFSGEFVPLRLQIYNNPVVYRKSQEIAETMVQGALSEDQILQEISAFIHAKVQQRAMQDNIIPIAGQEKSFGQVSSAELLNLVRLIRNWGRNVRVVAYVDHDIRAGDTLDLKFTLKL
jgi:uncharacterized protein (DUF3084 family)